MQSSYHPYLRCLAAMEAELKLIQNVFGTNKASEGYRSQRIRTDMEMILDNLKTDKSSYDATIILKRLEAWLDLNGIQDGIWPFASEHPVINDLRRFRADFCNQYGSGKYDDAVKAVVKLKDSYFEKQLQGSNASPTLQEQEENPVDFKERLTSLESKMIKLDEDNKRMAEEAKIHSAFTLDIFQRNQEVYQRFQQVYQAIEYAIPSDQKQEFSNALSIIPLKAKQVHGNVSTHGYDGTLFPSTTSTTITMVATGTVDNKVSDAGDAHFRATALCLYAADGSLHDKNFFKTRYGVILKLKQVCANAHENSDVLHQAKVGIRLLLVTKYIAISLKDKTSVRSIAEVKIWLSQLFNNVMPTEIEKAFGKHDDRQELDSVSESNRRTQFTTTEAQNIRQAYSSNYLPEDPLGKDIFDKIWRHLLDPNKEKYKCVLAYGPENYCSDCPGYVVKHDSEVRITH